MQIKKNATEGSITSASTSKRVGTASSTHGRSTANSTVASSVTSLKDDRGNSTSMRKRQLNAVKPRKHASAMSMSLDSSGFVASVSRKNDSVKSNDCAAVPATVTDVNVDVTSQKAREAVQDDEDAASQKAGEVVAQDEGYNDDFEQPPAETTVTASNDIGEGDGGYYEEVFEGNEEEKEEEVVVDALVVQKPAQEEEDEDVYDADFEHTGALPASDVTAPSPVQPSAPSPTLIPAAVSPPSATSEAVAEVVVKPSFSAETETVEAAEDIYENDFEQNATEISSAAEAEVEPAAAAATTTGDVPDDTAYGDDFEDADGKNAAAPVAAESVPAAVPEESSSTKTDTDKFLDSVKLRTDLLGASNNTAATARSVLSSEGIITDIRDEQATTSAVHTAPDSPVPSTVRSELDSHAVAPLESAPHSHTNSVRSADLEAETTDQRTAAVVEVQQPKPASSSEQGDGVDTENLLSKARQDAKVGEADSGRQHLPVREEPEYSHFLGNSDKLDASVEQVFSDDPIDEILYVEGKVGSDKAGDAISNNFLNSPQRGGISKNTFEEMPGSVVSSPGGPQINNPDEEIGEEIE